MAVQTDGSRFGTGAWETLKRGIGSCAGSLSALGNQVGDRAQRFYAGVGAARTRFRATRVYRLLTTGPLIRFISRTLQRRIIFANTIGLAILLGGIFYLSQYHAWLIDAKRESLRAQGDIIAAAIVAKASVETGRIVLDPDRLPELEGARSPFRDDGFAALQLSIAPERVTPILRRLVPRGDVRARVYAQDGTLIIDTDQLLSRGQVARDVSPVPEPQQERVRVKNGWTRFLSWLTRGDLPVYREIGSANGKAYPEVRIALGGSATPMLLVNEKGEQIVSMAVPIQYRKAVRGVLLLSTRPGEIDEILAEERYLILLLALTALSATLLASWLLARTIAGPMHRLSEAAKTVSTNIKARRELPDYGHRADEVGQMATAFREMTEALYRRVEASERFAQDVAHELKNPLTAARSTAEALAYAKTSEQQRQLVREIQDELKRLNKLITDVSNAARLDAEMTLQEMEPVDVCQLLQGVAGVFRDMLSSDTRRVEFDFEGSLQDRPSFIVMAHEARLGRVITNLLDNALSFSPQRGVVTVRTRRVGREIEILVEDQGPGIPADKLEDIFSRFYSDRPQTDRTVGKNSGLGLSISRDIVTAYGGTIRASNIEAAPDKALVIAGEPQAFQVRRASGILGARFTVRLPAADATILKGTPVGRRG
jgi:two-component system sensor histidine kinase ChvG